MFAKFANEDELRNIEDKVRDMVEDATEQAKNDPFPDESELYTNIYK